jgi:hypothetical protein
MADDPVLFEQVVDVSVYCETNTVAEGSVLEAGGLPKESECRATVITEVFKNLIDSREPLFIGDIEPQA